MTIANVIESGRLLQAAFDCFEHGDRDGYHQWIETEIGWSPRQAARYRDVFDFSQICQTGKYGEREIAELNISKGALYMLAANRADDDMTAAIKVALQQATKLRMAPAQVSEVFAKHARSEPQPEAEPDVDAETDAEAEIGDADVETGDDAVEPPAELLVALEVLRNNKYSASEWNAAVKAIGGTASLRGIINALETVYKGDGGGRIKLAADLAWSQSEAKAKKTVLQ